MLKTYFFPHGIYRTVSSSHLVDHDGAAITMIKDAISKARRLIMVSLEKKFGLLLHCVLLLISLSFHIAPAYSAVLQSSCFFRSIKFRSNKADFYCFHIYFGTRLYRTSDICKHFANLRKDYAFVKILYGNFPILAFIFIK